MLVSISVIIPACDAAACLEAVKLPDTESSSLLKLSSEGQAAKQVH